MNYIDLLIIIIFVFYVFVDYHRGFLRLCADLLGLIIAFLIALTFYEQLSDFLITHTSLSVVNAKPLSFIAIWFVSQLIFYLFSKIISFYTPTTIKQSHLNRYLGILPAMIKGIVFITVSMILIVVMPLNQKTKNLFTNSLLGKTTLKYAVNFEGKLEKIFGGSSNTLTFLTHQETPDATTPLNFSTTQMEIDEEAENVLLQKINEERAKIGISPLQQDILIRNVARTHSRDMLIRGYFSHNSQDNKTLADRLISANATFQAAAENIALAPNANLAHLGLMNSEKHKTNILDPEFTRVGIGVMNAGQYGIMVTQDFVN